MYDCVFCSQINRRDRGRALVALTLSEQANEGEGGKTDCKINEKTAIELEGLMAQALWQARLKYEEMEGITRKNGEQAIAPSGTNDFGEGSHGFVHRLLSRSAVPLCGMPGTHR